MTKTVLRDIIMLKPGAVLMHLPVIDDIHEAADRIRTEAVFTPLLEWDILNRQTGGRILAKAETFQRTGSFKFRGAYNRISRVNKAEFPGGVVACSSGNHAQGVAEAARLCGLKAVIVMPADAPQMKVDRTRRSGADIVFYDRETEDRNAIARDLCVERHADFVSPYDDFYIIAGQGTAGLELCAQAVSRDAKIDAVLVPAGGGGLTAGVLLAVKDAFPAAHVHCAEPEGFDDHNRSMAAGMRKHNLRTTGSICDSLLTPEPGELTFAINGQGLSGGVVVNDADVRRAVAYAYRELKLVVEPGGAIGLAALLSGAFPVKDRTVAVVLSGGNIDPRLFAEIITAEH